MPSHIRKFAWLGLASLLILSFTIGAVAAHEGRPVGDYRFVVGWLEEPAYEGFQNAVSVTISKVAEGESEGGDSQSSGGQHGSGDSQHEEGGGHGESEDTDSGSNGDHDDSRMVEKDSNRSMAPQAAAKPMASMTGQQHERTAPVEGLEGSIQVEVTHSTSGASKTLALIAVFGEPGHYVAHLIPTASGVYEFRVFGTIEGTAIDETFASKGAGGGFDDIRSSAGLQFPEELPELREIESGVRGALTTAQQAQDAALAAQQDDSSNTLTVVALIVGIAGVVIAVIAFIAGSVLPALRQRDT